MKKHLFFCLSLLLLLTACSKSEDENPWVAPIVPENPGTPETPDNPDSPNAPDNVVDGHEYVDLGLPSGTLWATCNVGATSPADYGDYFAWGETAPKENYDWSTYKWYNGRGTSSAYTFTKYNTKSSCGTVDNKTLLEAADDAATANWGAGWRMPSFEEVQELLSSSYCTWTWTSKTNSAGETINGYEVKSKSNGNSIFLPAAGYRLDTSLLNNAGSSGHFWCSSLSSYYHDPSQACNLGASSGGCGLRDSNRYCGFSVRPVCALGDDPVTPDETPDEPETPSTPDGVVDGHEYVDLGLPSGTLWATMNVGATSTTDSGDYFAWGETAPKENYDWSTYKWYNGAGTSSANTFTKYNTKSSYGTVDNKTVLEAADDAATANWGTGWRMPSFEEVQELLSSSYCTWTWRTLNGVNGQLVVGPNGNSIFLPAAGYRYYTSLYGAGSYGYYWSSSLSSNIPSSAYYLIFGPGIHDPGWGGHDRCWGQSVRPVRASARN